jgi:hypothetical protein
MKVDGPPAESTAPLWASDFNIALIPIPIEAPRVMTGQQFLKRLPKSSASSRTRQMSYAS